MFIKQFRSLQVRVPDPLRPGKRTFEERLIPAGACAISHDGQSFEADEDGWFDLPADVAEHMLRFRHPRGEQFFTPEQVNEEVAAGRIDQDSADAMPQVTAVARAKPASARAKR